MAYFLRSLRQASGRVAFHKSFILRSSCCILQRAKESIKSDRNNNVENRNGSKDISTRGRPGNGLPDTLPRSAPCRSAVGLGNRGRKRDSRGCLEGLRRV